MNLEFAFAESPIVFKIEELNEKQRMAHERAIRRAQKYLVTEAELLESIIEVDQLKLYEKFGESYLTPYCVKYLGLSEDVAAVFVRVARKSVKVPELKQAIDEGDLCVNKARAISSVITKENQSAWIEKAKTLSKHKLEKEVAKESPLKAKPEKARHIGNDLIQIVIHVSVEEFERRERIKDLVSQQTNKLATDRDVELAMMDCYEFHKDPVRKAERAARKKEKRPIDPSRDGSRVTSTEVFHQVDLRDGRKCQARIADGTVCGEPRWIHHHHIIPRSRGGLDVPENIITLCASHHRLWHKRDRG